MGIMTDFARPDGVASKGYLAMAGHDRPGIIDARKQTAAHGTPPDLLRCELAAVGYQQTAFYDLQESTYLAVFALPSPPAGPTSPAAIRPCSSRHS